MKSLDLRILWNLR